MRRGAMAACARVNCAEERARMAEECPGATNSPARHLSQRWRDQRRRFACISFEARTISLATNDTCGRVKDLHQGGHLVLLSAFSAMLIN
eukprot:6187050-Pleurochrysis_carterae.AAC.6